MYRVLYRKWRPQTFSDVVGQPQVTVALRCQIKENRLSHAYLFTGSRGTGKTSCAKIFAKAVNCLHPVGGDPCNECEICKGIDDGTVLDIVEIDAASNRGVDDIRQLREEVKFTPSQAKFRVYIVDEVHMLTIEAFNALLKTLEEPPEHVKFILATTEVQKLPSTILSRCQRYDFRRIEPEIIADRLQKISEEEGATLEKDAAVLIARLADGAMRDALSLLDRCLSTAEPPLTVQTVTQAAGLMGRDYLFNLCRTVANRDTAAALTILDDLHKASCDTERLCTELINQFRNLLIVHTVQHPEKLIVATNEEIEENKKLASLFTTEAILRALNVLSDAVDAIKKTQNRRVEAEMALI
ncbi:MAG: DNA polymerase III subunit gamma/tau, partial [Clostridia bacterium]|nr:DNA polymerase III subunit gamma/tau [Clostridia bacterium]